MEFALKTLFFISLLEIFLVILVYLLPFYNSLIKINKGFDGIDDLVDGRIMHEQKKKILLLTQHFCPESLLPFDVAKALYDSGLSVDVICGQVIDYPEINSEKRPKFENISGVKIYRKNFFNLKSNIKIARIINYFLCTLMFFFSLFNMKNYKAIIVYSTPPILIAIAALAKKLFGIKIIFVSYDVYPEIAINSDYIAEKGIISRVMNLINKKFFKNCSKIIVISNDMKKFIIKNRTIDDNKVSVIHNWSTEEKREVRSINNVELKKIRKKYELVISYFGNMGTVQDMNTIIDTIQFLNNRNVAFVFAGHGNKMEWLDQTMSKKNLNNCFIFDYLKGQDFLEALEITDLFIVSLEKGLGGLAVPSKTYTYYQSGKPVIAIMDEFTDIYREIRDFHAGISIKNGESKKLAKKIEYLLSKKSEIVVMQNNLRRMVKEKNYNSKFLLNKYVQEIKDVLNL
jgi:glycosyltransferase involved in cell wall biosynthesis